MGTSRPHLDPDQIAERIGAMATDAATVAVGLGILGVNRLQALRREAAARLADLAGPSSDDTSSDDPPAKRSE